MEVKVILVAGAIILALVTFLLFSRSVSKGAIFLEYTLYVISGIMIIAAWFIPSENAVPSQGYCILMAIVAIVFCWWLISAIGKYIVAIAIVVAAIWLTGWLIQNAAANNNMILLIILIGGVVFLAYGGIRSIIKLLKK